jgi:murein DD-endopeptidase MepM/ murein hydrolase activator NlpD
VIERANVIDSAKGYKYNVDYKYWVGNLHGKPDQTYVYQLPYRHGEQHLVSQSYFGDFSHQRGSTEEYAVDFDMPTGTPVLAARDGIVVEVETTSNEGGAEEKYKKCRNEVAIRHADGSYALYAHLRQNGAVVKVGDRVTAGDLIAYSGATGFCSGPHLHFCLFVPISGTTCRSFPMIFRTRYGDLPKLEPDIVY